MSKEKTYQAIDLETAIQIDDALLEAHTLVAEDIVKEHSEERIERAERVLHQLRNNWAATVGLNLRCPEFKDEYPGGQSPHD